MDLIKLAEDLGLEETKEYKYRIRPEENSRGYYYIERLNKGNGFLCSIAVSDTMLLSLREGLIEEFASLLHNNFNSAENKALIKRAEYHEETIPSYNYSETEDRVEPIIKDGK